MNTRITELLDIKYPIIQGAMSWVSFPPLVAAVSNAGGLGILGAAFMAPDELRENIVRIKDLTDQPFGVNFMADNPILDDLLEVLITEKVKVASYGKGNPEQVIAKTRPHGIVNMPTVGSLRHALKAERDGADALIVQGTEGGGHTGFVATSILVPLVSAHLNIPIVAAGGIGNARGLVAALALGAEGVSMGSRFIVTQEAPVPYHVKQHLVDRSEEDTIITDNFTGVRCRVMKNQFSENLRSMARNGSSPWEIMKTGVGKIRKAYVEGDIDGGSLAFGQVCGLIREIPTCQELIEGMVRESRMVWRSVESKIRNGAA
ncbi:MAG: nitronate monooxygenase [Proteobacteria bacterium]|nr:nitronate monooxygenase [Pseudomonadota bacterium]